MPSNRRLNYLIGFTADTIELLRALLDVYKSLNTISSMSTVNTNLSSDLFEAAKAAQLLNQFLLNATTSTGGLDLSKFNASLLQSGMELKDYANRLIAIGPQGEEAFLKVAAAIGRAETPLIRVSSLMDRLWITMKNTMRWQITSSALLGFIGSLLTAYGYAQDLNESLTNIRIVTENSLEDMAKFAKLANEAAKTLSTTTVDYTDAALIYYQQGLSEQEVLDRTAVTIKMANAAGVSALIASDQLTAIWNNFYDGSKSLEYYADVMVRLGADTASSTDEISEGILKFASVADTVGLSYEYAASALATVTATTRESANTVGTAFKTIFARIQGLNFGETLDDGTTLNKYSLALEKVGIDIFDVNGEIKNMDTLLNEMGAKWNTLSNDLLIALAQTVAGVRQYTRLVALMDNWDFFLENLASAYGAEGSLQEQADILAESWEAARDRMTAAAEDIYDSVFNPDLFIAIDNTITPLLSGIADVTDALGGLPGILNVVGSFMTSAFSDKISESIRDIAYNINLLRGNISLVLNNLRENAGNIALSLASDSARAASSNSKIARELSYTIAKTQIQSEDIMLQNSLSALARLMTEELLKLLSAYKDIITLMKLIGLEQLELVDSKTQEVDKILLSLEKLISLTKESLNYAQAIRLIRNLLNNKNLNVQGLDLTNSTKSVSTMIAALRLLNTVIGSVSLILTELKSIGTEGSKNSEVVNGLKRRFQELTGINIAGSTFDQSMTLIESTLRTLETSADHLFTTLKNNGASGLNLNPFIEDALALGSSLESTAFITNSAAQETEKYLLSVYNATLKQRDWAFTIVTTANLLMNLSLVFSSILNLIQTWNNEDFTFGEKMVSTLTSIGMIAPLVVSAILLINSAKTSYATITVAGTTATNAEILSLYAATAATAAHTTSKVVETKVVEGNTVAVIANTTAWYGNPLFWIIATITAVVAAFSAYTAAVEENSKALIENAKAIADEKNEQVKLNLELRDSINELYREYIDLRTNLDGTSKSKDDLREHTRELLKALGEEQYTIDLLSDSYDKLNKRIAEANKRSILEDLEDLDESVSDQQNAIKYQWRNNALSIDDDFDFTLSPKIGLIGQDEYTFNQAFLDFMNDRYPDGYLGIEFEAGTSFPEFRGFSFKFNEEAYDEAMLALSDFIDFVKNPENEVDYSGSEGWTNLLELYEAVTEFHERVVDANELKLQLAQLLALVEADLLGYDLADIDTIEEYNQYVDVYKNNLKDIFDLFNITPETENGTPEEIEAYFDDLAEQYLSGYSNIADLIDRSNLLEEVLLKIGTENLDIIESFINDDDRDIIALSNINWEVIANEDDFEAALEEAYEAVKLKVDAANFEELLLQVNSIMSDLSEGNDLTDVLITLLEALESEYTKLASIRDRGSAQYIQALRDIREGMENVISTNAMNELLDAWDLLAMISKEGSTRKNWIIGIDLDDADFQENMKAILDADYAVLVAIEADLKSDVDDVLNYANAVQQATSLIQEGFKVSYDDIDALTAVFPGILAGYTTTADGMIQLNSEIALSSIDLASTLIAADRDAARQNIESYQLVLLAKAAAMRLIAEGLWELTQTSEDNANAQAKIDEGITNFKSACADELNLISEGLTESEIDDSNLIMAANENAAGTSANNWANAYDSMAKNSAEWARIAIDNANAVAKAMKGAEEGRVVTPEVTSGGIASSYTGTTEDYVYSGTYESRGQDNVDWFDYYESGDYQAAYEAAILQAEGYEQAAAAMTGMLAKLDGAASTVDNLANTVGRDTSGSGGDNEGTVYDPEAEKTLEDIEDRYHEINREIEDQNSLLEDVGNNIERAYGNRRKLQAYEKELQELNKLQENYNKKLAKAETYLDFDKTNLQSLFDNSLTFDENGEIQGYQQVLQSMIDDYNNNFLADYNAFLAEFSALTKAEQEARQAEYDSWQQLKTVADELFQKRQDALAQYEETLDTILEIRDSQEEIARNIADNRLSLIEYKLEVVLDVKEAKDAVLELTRDIVESFGDMLTHGIRSTRIGWKEALGNINVIDDYYDALNSYQNELANATDATDIARIMDNLADLQSLAISTADALLEWVESLETLLPDALEDASERFAQFTDQLEHNESILGLIEELYALLGVTYKTQEGFDLLLRVGRETMEAQVAQAQLHRSWYENSRLELLEAQAALDALGGNETDPAYDGLKANRDALLEEFNEAQEAMLSSAQAAMETAQEMYTQAIERAVYEFGQVVSGGVGLDLLQDKFDHYIDQEGRYLDTVNEAYEVASWYNKLQEDIDKTTNSATKERLKALQEEIDIRRENNTLSEYDLEILEAKYNILQAQIALEEAQNAKNELRLVRDRLGNWNYQYTADLSQIADAELNLLDAENEWYNIAKQLVEDVTGEIISTWQECQSAIEEVYNDMTLTDEERAARAEEIYAYYTQKIQDLENEKQVAIADMTEAGNKSLFDMAVVAGDEVSDLTGMTSQEIQDIIANSGMSIIELLMADNKQIKDIVGSNTQLIDLFDNVFAKDLANMTANAGNFEDYLSQAMSEAEGAMTQYQDTVSSVADETGTSLDDLSGYIDDVSTSTDICRDAGLEATEMMWDLIDAIHDLSQYYLDLADSVYEYIKALRDLAAEISNTISNESGLSGGTSSGSSGYDPNTDYSSVIENGIVNGWLQYGSDEYNELFNLRENKINDMGLLEEHYGSRGDAADKLFAGMQQGDSLSQWAQGDFNSREEWEQKLESLGIKGFSTGGYTGDFNDSKLAFLHEKELVLNLDDTKNILSAVSAMRALGPEFIASIESALDNNALSAKGLMASRLGNNTQVAPANGTIEQRVTIEHVEFPNVTSSDEIQDALRSLVDDAAQWASRRKG